ncbi:hypothetical protein [Izhakiella australiensis]|uniref:hypothetical protein n=1 Tax=Izhakiella australiensis TaxID=1926881 RepID=UPI001590965C|nr:hypothetical protein [Izhakiella australiensis]
MSELDDFQARTVRLFLEDNWDLFVAHCHVDYAEGEELAEEIFEALGGEGV